MTTELQRLIDAVRAARAIPDDDPSATHTEMFLRSDEYGAVYALADYMLAHAAAFAERDRLERAAIAEYLKHNAFGPAYYEFIRHLVSNAASDDPAARS